MASVPAVCGIAAKMMDSAIIVGTAADGSIKMMTTIEDVAEIIWHLEAAKHSLMSGDFEDQQGAVMKFKYKTKPYEHQRIALERSYDKTNYGYLYGS